MRHRLVRIALLPLFVIAFHVAGCSKNPVRGIGENFWPETELTYAPPEGDTTSFRVHFYWTGFDNDGEVVRFRYALDSDTLKPIVRWRTTTAHDTTIVLTVGPGALIQGHVLWVAAEDNSGLLDPSPAKRYFSIRTLPPSSRITQGPEYAMQTSSSVTFAWTGSDPDGGSTGGPARVDSFEYLLLRPGYALEAGHPALPTFPGFQAGYLDLINKASGPSLQPPYDDWKWHGISGASHRFTGLLPGFYLFALRAVDAAGARDVSLAFSRNVRYFTVASPPVPPPAPFLTISSPILNSSIRIQVSPVLISSFGPIETLEGDAVPLAWTGAPGGSGSPIAGYSFALDDTVGTSWSVIDPRRVATTLPVDLAPGPHALFVRVVDLSGGATIGILGFTVVHPAFRDPPGTTTPSLLFVDDFAPPPGDWSSAVRGGPNYPTDAAEYDWWQRIILAPLSSEFGVGYEEWDAVLRGTYSVDGRATPTLQELSRHRVVIWYADFNNTLSAPTALWNTLFLHPSSALAAYVRGGGTLIVTGFQLAAQTSGRSNIPYVNGGMCANLGEGTLNWQLSYFPREFMGIDGALGSFQSTRTTGALDFVEARITAEGSSLGFQTAEVDTGGPGTGAKWNPYAFFGSSPDMWLAPGLPQIDGLKLADPFACLPNQGLLRRENPGAPIAVPILTYHGVDQGVLQDRGPSPREGLVVGIATQAHDMGQGDGSTVTPASSHGVMGRMVFLGFPIYYAKDAQAYAVMRAAFAYVNASPTLPAGVP